MIDPLTMLAIFTAASGAMGSLLWAKRKARAKYTEVWLIAAGRLNGEFIPKGGTWYAPTPMAIRAKVGGVRVYVDSYIVSNDNSSVKYTRIVAGDAHVGTVHLDVRERTILSSVGKLFGAQDVDVSRPELGDRVIKASDEALARAWISPTVARAIAASAPYSFSLQGSKLTVLRTGMEDDADRLARVTRAAAEFMARGRELVAAWSSLAGALGGVVEEPLVLVDRAVQGKISALRHSVEVTIDFALDDQQTVTAVRACRKRHDDAFTIVQGASPKPTGDPEFDATYTVEITDDTTTAPSAEAREKLLACKPLKVIARREHLTLLLFGLELDQERMLAAVDAVALLATGSTVGPYR